MATAQEHSQWVTMMRQWMMQLDDRRTAAHLSRPPAELKALATYEDVAERELV